jgi:hypothetical protein
MTICIEGVFYAKSICFVHTFNQYDLVGLWAGRIAYASSDTADCRYTDAHTGPN